MAVTRSGSRPLRQQPARIAKRDGINNMKKAQKKAGPAAARKNAKIKAAAVDKLAEYKRKELQREERVKRQRKQREERWYEWEDKASLVTQEQVEQAVAVPSTSIINHETVRDIAAAMGGASIIARTAQLAGLLANVVSTVRTALRDFYRYEIRDEARWKTAQTEANTLVLQWCQDALSHGKPVTEQALGQFYRRRILNRGGPLLF